MKVISAYTILARVFLFFAR